MHCAMMPNAVLKVFHIPQAQQYCGGDFKSWDPMITTLPGLYLFAVSNGLIFNATKELNVKKKQGIGYHYLYVAFILPLFAITAHVRR